jgi:hypothetical protein
MNITKLYPLKAVAAVLLVVLSIWAPIPWWYKLGAWIWFLGTE